MGGSASGTDSSLTACTLAGNGNIVTGWQGSNPGFLLQQVVRARGHLPVPEAGLQHPGSVARLQEDRSSLMPVLTLDLVLPPDAPAVLGYPLLRPGLRKMPKCTIGRGLQLGLNKEWARHAGSPVPTLPGDSNAVRLMYACSNAGEEGSCMMPLVQLPEPLLNHRMSVRKDGQISKQRGCWQVLSWQVRLLQSMHQPAAFDA
ncbi:MAG: hypothetical protein FRX49_01410 [Trebouxia sp. A1-2]|nr:MAG: hypothetical protein FRX49_01410 [Trebouxia sp. A1-2]